MFNNPLSSLAITNPALPVEGDFNNFAASGGPLASLIARLWETFAILGGLLLIIYFVWGAIEWITSGGTEDKLKHARYKMTNAFIGLFLLMMTFSIVMFLDWVFGFNLLKLNWPTLTTN